jgi:2,3-dihydroxybiphenyl 1,2-dioxygenase
MTGEARDPDLFGATSMGYVVVESRRLDAWQRFLEGGLGMHLAGRGEGSLAFRMDEHACRVLVTHGGAEDVAAVGYQARDVRVLEVLLARLSRLGVDHTPGSQEEANARGVRSFVRVRGPKGMGVELFVDPVTSPEPLSMKTSAFVTGEAGMGHVAITSRRPEAMAGFWKQVFDARHSDWIEERLGGVSLDIEFLRLNRRHHSVAIAGTRGLRLDPIRTRVQHFNVEVATLDDLLGAFLRCRALGFEIAHELGQHPNDLELSFYAVSPSGFEVECGWRAKAVDEASWKPAVHQGISLWGHRPERLSLASQLRVNVGNLGRGLRSLLRPEFAPGKAERP